MLLTNQKITLWSFFLLLSLGLNAQQVSNYKATWIGNTYGKGGDPNDTNAAWVQNYIGSMYVTEDGTVYTESVWDEGGRTHGVYKDGKVLGNKDHNIDCSEKQMVLLFTETALLGMGIL